jgi:hypothetical protein
LTICGVALLASALVACTGTSSSQIPTFTKDVAPILFSRCAPCHRSGQQAPFTLTSYTDKQPRARRLAAAAAARRMPPWVPDRCDPPLVGERHLSDDEIATIERRAQADAPEGNPADLPRLPQWPAEPLTQTGS